MFKIVCVGGNQSRKFINKCFQSVIDQTYLDWHMVVILDPGEYQIEVQDRRLKVYINKNQQGGVHNTITSAAMLECYDEDILVFLDADDYLYCKDALETVVKTYDDYPETLVTHGSFIIDPPEEKGSVHFKKPLTQDDVDNIRGFPFRTSHLRTMKYKIFSQIKNEDYRDETGEYLKTTVDLATMIPAVEMAGLDRIKFISKILHCYRHSGKRPDKYRRQVNDDCNRIYNKPPYMRGCHVEGCLCRR